MSSQGASAQGLVDKIRDRGYVNCAGSQGVPGLSRPDEKGVWRGFDSDVCRAIAVTILGDKDRVRFVPLNAAKRLPAVQTGEIDILSRTTTLTYERDLAVRFVGVSLYDSDAVLVRKELDIKVNEDFEGLTFCLQGGGSLTEKALDELQEMAQIDFERVYFDSTITARDSYLAGRCDAYVTDGLAAWGQRAAVAKNPEDHDVIYIGYSVEPNAIGIPRGDDRLFDIVRWTLNALIWAEANGITSENVDSFLESDRSEIRRVLGMEPGFGAKMGVSDKWAYNVIKQIGNYGEIWDRNLGKRSPLKADRRWNKLFSEDGLLFPLPWD
ncbi:MAG TPA: transporter substrate-binding domain-containing protein [Alphaproteobacteria bacterium]|nr:transporter substrate-binding domain-containing protein [Alphaproteobacteria bacterium]